MATEVDRYEVQRLMAGGAQVVDVMGAGEWEASHLADAVHIPLARLPELADERLDRGRPVVAYCYDSL